MVVLSASLALSIVSAVLLALKAQFAINVKATFTLTLAIVA